MKQNMHKIKIYLKFWFPPCIIFTVSFLVWLLIYQDLVVCTVIELFPESVMFMFSSCFSADNARLRQIFYGISITNIKYVFCMASFSQQALLSLLLSASVANAWYLISSSCQLGDALEVWSGISLTTLPLHDVAFEKSRLSPMPQLMSALRLQLERGKRTALFFCFDSCRRPVVLSQLLIIDIQKFTNQKKSEKTKAFMEICC